MAIYYWNNQGRLGNLLFQYAAIMAATTDEDFIICFDNSAFESVNYDKRFFVIKLHEFLHFFLNRRCNDFFSLLSRNKIISSYSPELSVVSNKFFSEKLEVLLKVGAFKSVCEIKGFFHHDKWIFNNIVFRGDRLNEARLKLSYISSSRCKVAVHIRSTDYKEWVILGKKDATLSLEWYKKAIIYAVKNLKNPEFIFFTDDEKYVRSLDLSIPINIFKGGNPVDDLIAMSLCDHAIISPSSFSYIASMQSYKENKLIVAPRYWLGFKSKIWYPSAIETNRMHYLDEC
jgi:hypothetical protein